MPQAGRLVGKTNGWHLPKDGVNASRLGLKEWLVNSLSLKSTLPYALGAFCVMCKKSAVLSGLRIVRPREPKWGKP